MRKMQYLGLGAVLCALVLLLASANVVCAQEVTATITGTVTDSTGAAVAGATVTAKSVERGTVFKDVTNEVGIYRITQLPVGNYDLRVEKEGFQTALFPSFTLVLNQIARIDVALKVGQVSQAIEVTGAAPVLKTETTQVDTIINAATNEAIPLATRNYVELTLLAPGTVTTDPHSFNTGDNTGSGGRPLINGNREQANNFLLDGMDNNQVSDNLLGYAPSPDAIQEFNLITSNAPAEFGNFQGGIVNATIKSGTNSFHGDAWEFFRNDVLNANSWSNRIHQPDPLPKEKVRWNMFGATFGGPILKNKLFFFADYQGQRFNVPSSSSANTVFTDLERTGDFGALCSAGFDGSGNCLGSGQLYNPCASFTAPCTPSSAPAGTRSPFPFNRIPAVMISPVASNLFASELYPTPVSDQLQQNAVNINASAFKVDQGDLRLDYKATEKDSISYRFSRSYQNNPKTNSQVLLSNSNSTTPIYNTVGDWTRTIGTNLVTDARVGWSHVTVNAGTSWDSSVGQFGNTLGIGNGNPANLDGLLGINFTNSAVTNFGTQESAVSFDDHVWRSEERRVGKECRSRWSPYH